MNYTNSQYALLEEIVVHVLSSAGSSLSRHILFPRCRANARRHDLFPTSTEILHVLMNLQAKKRVRIERGRWCLNETGQKESTHPPSFDDFLKTLSPEGQSIIGSQTPHSPDFSSAGRWTLFRNLLQYYQDCLKSEEGAEPLSWLSEQNKDFFFLRPGTKLPLYGKSWSLALRVGDSERCIARNLPPRTSDAQLVLGYPIAIRTTKGLVPSISLTSVFYFALTATFDGMLHLSIPDPEVQVCVKWLDEAFSSRKEKKLQFLGACGLMSFGDESDKVLEPRNLGDLVQILSIFQSDALQEELLPLQLSSKDLPSLPEDGIYNRAVVMRARRTRFNGSLCQELKAIAEAPDDVLDGTALATIFPENTEDNCVLNASIVSEGIVPDYLSMNAEQRTAVASLLTKPLTVITGPPGSGKSQVIASLAAAIRLTGQSMLFSSRNHKAIDAVMQRVTNDNGRDLVTRANSKENPSLNFTFAKAAKSLLTCPWQADKAEQLRTLQDTLQQLLAERKTCAEMCAHQSTLSDALGSLQEELDDLLQKLGISCATQMVNEQSWPTLPEAAITRFLDFAAHRQGQRNLPFFCFWKARLLLMFDWRSIVVFLQKLAPFVPINFTERSCHSCLLDGEFTRKLSLIQRIYSLRKQILPLANSLRGTVPIHQLVADLASQTKKIQDVTTQAVQLDAEVREGLRPEFSRKAVGALESALRSLQQNIQSPQQRAETRELLTSNLSAILAGFPCWAVTSLSVGSHIPLLPRIFDLAVLDEAGQSDIPSAIPILFRARRAGVVGDPWQLPCITKISTQREHLFLGKHHIPLRSARFFYGNNSFFDLAAGSNSAWPVLLAATYRSAPDIAEYSNALFYKGRLRVVTDVTRLNVPSGMATGIHWTDVQGVVERSGPSGCICTAEIETVVRLVRELLMLNSFKGTVGVVTPFRQQADRINDTLYRSDTAFAHALQAAECYVSTAHGFQGDERDVMFLSLCGGPNMPSGSHNFLATNGRLFNVAASRARAVLHIVGNRQWAKTSGIPHIEQLTIEPTVRQRQYVAKGLWAPCESPWEKVLMEALQAAGLQPLPQLPIAGRRLDLALCDNQRNVFIDIEVDGDCHRTSNGTRQTDDIWRDIQLQGRGWLVLRFWTYELRENLDDCVSRIVDVWRQDGNRE
ncbi:MAG: AAA family ATPase [Desulfovibrionaceae bacterium]|nr:AAA family ATPase [Desulfovibrionaceae bacterium]